MLSIDMLSIVYASWPASRVVLYRSIICFLVHLFIVNPGANTACCEANQNSSPVGSIILVLDKELHLGKFSRRPASSIGLLAAKVCVPVYTITGVLRLAEHDAQCISIVTHFLLPPRDYSRSITKLQPYVAEGATLW